MWAHFSIRYKFLMVSTFLLLLCVGAYLLMATKLFEQDKTELVYDYNKNIVSSLHSDINGLLSKVSDRVELLTHLKSDAELSQFLQRNKDIVYLGKSYNFEKIEKDVYFDQDFLKNYELRQEDLASNYFSKIDNFTLKLRKGESVWPLPQANDVPLIGFNKTIVKYDKNLQPVSQYSIVVLVNMEKIYSSVDKNNYSDVAVFTSDGEVVLGTMSKDLFDLIYDRYKQSSITTSVTKIQFQNKSLLGAYSKLEEGLLVISTVDSDKAFQAVNTLFYRSALFASIVLTLSFIAAIFFSKSLTRPIEILAAGMRKVSSGKLDTKIDVQTKDEIQTLAKSFNSMIVDLKRSRIDLENANKNLENKVEERTRQLDVQNQAVKSAQEALLKSTRLAAVGEIAGRAAHEVLNPLTNIINRTQIIKKKESVSKQVQVIQDIRSAWEEDYKAGEFKTLIENWEKPSDVYAGKSLWEEDLMNLKNIEDNLLKTEQEMKEDILFLMKESSRINKIVQSMRSMSKVKSELREYDPDELLQESINIMADLASKYHVKINYESKPDTGRVKVEYDEFIQSLTNLLRNSIQAITEKQQSEQFVGEIKIILTEKSESYEIKIIDNGMGIQQDDKEKLFKTQFTTKSDDEGTGLGLNISRRFIRSFHGDIQLMHSEYGVGTTMLIDLPKVRLSQESA